MKKTLKELTKAELVEQLEFAKGLKTKPISEMTLKKYGLSRADIDFIFLVQTPSGDRICPICEKPPKFFVVDHDHVKALKKMPAAIKRQYVRGVACSNCNYRWLFNQMTLRKARNVVTDLERYERAKGK